MTTFLLLVRTDWKYRITHIAIARGGQIDIFEAIADLLMLSAIFELF